mmetsp:Transcript_40187/g.89167  ORF Transcript_40187/g.89167 Transcript_40187/m.89167 type:complete len:753 (+) Transcript_40187:85-2343(+)
MSFIQPATIQAIAHSIDIPKLSDEAAKALAPDVEYRLREILQDATKFARHSKRLKLTVEDINSALRLRNFEPVYGFNNRDPAKYVRATGHPDVYFVQDRELSFEQVVDAPLQRPPLEVGMVPHWLFINGVQPVIPENALLEKPGGKRVKPMPGPEAVPVKPAAAAATPEPAKAIKQEAAAKAAGAVSAAALATSEGAVHVQQPVQHVLSKELQLYFDKVVTCLKQTSAAPTLSSQPGNHAAAAAALRPGAVAVPGPAGPGAAASQELEARQRAMLASLASDAGLQPLAPYFTKFIADEVAAGLKSVPLLHMLLRLVHSLLLNPHMQLEYYIHQLLPPILTCMVAKTIGAHPLEDHWSVRDAAARLVQLVCTRYGQPYYNVQPRISKTLLKAFLDATKPLATHYGAIQGLSALGSPSVRMLLIPQLEPYLQKLQPLLADKSNPVRRGDAWRVYGALLDGVGTAMYERLVATFAEGLPQHLLMALARPRRHAPLKLEDVGTSDAAAPSKAAAKVDRTTPPGAAAGSAGDASGAPCLVAVLQAQEGAGPAAGAAAGGDTGAAVKLHIRCLKPGEKAEEVRGGMMTSLGVTVSRANGGMAKPKGGSQAADAAGAPRQGKRKRGADADGNSAIKLDNGGEAMDLDGNWPSSNGVANNGEDAMQVDGHGASSSGSVLRAEPPPWDSTLDWPVKKVQVEAAEVAFKKARAEEQRWVREVLAQSWREDADLAQVLGALTVLFGDAFVARMPQTLLASCPL